MRTSLLAGALITACTVALAAASPAARTDPPGRPAAASVQAAAETQLLDALQVRIAAARALEAATLAAVDQRLRAIYAVPTEDPLIALLAGDVQQAQALGELSAAMTRSDDALLWGYTNSLANLQTAQAELADNMLRITAARRIAAARRVAQTISPANDADARRLAPVSAAPGGGIPASIATAHTLPGALPIDPRTGRPYAAGGGA
jgi:hypothetical protein